MNIEHLELPDHVHRFIEMQALAHFRSVEEEAAALLTAISDADKRRGDEAWDRICHRRELMLAARGGVPFPDSTPLIRESREHDH